MVSKSHLRQYFKLSVINALVLFNSVTSSKLSVTHFRAALLNFVEQLIKKVTIPNDLRLIQLKHKLEIAGKSRCSKCYGKLSQEKGRTYAQLHSTKTKCLLCDKYYCRKCFFEYHQFTNK